MCQSVVIKNLIYLNLGKLNLTFEDYKRLYLTEKQSF